MTPLMLQTFAQWLCNLVPLVSVSLQPSGLLWRPSRTAKTRGSQEALLADVLALLADCLVDSSSAVVVAAQRTLRCLLHTPAGAAALARLPEPARSYVGVFQGMEGAAAAGVPLSNEGCTPAKSDSAADCGKCMRSSSLLLSCVCCGRSRRGWRCGRCWGGQRCAVGGGRARV